MAVNHSYKHGFKRSTPIKGKGSQALCQRLARAFIDACHDKGLVVTDMEHKIRSEGRISVYKGKISSMATGHMRPYQYVFFFEVLFESIGCELNDFIHVRAPEASPEQPGEESLL